MFKVRLDRKRIVEIALVAAAYCVACIAGRTFAISPGYVTAIFPASGVALAAILLRGYGMSAGVFIGAFFANLVLLHADGHGGAFVLPAMTIAGAATLQAAGAGALIRRYTDDPLALDDAGDIFKFLAIGGPLGALVSATAGIGVLHAIGVIAPGDATQDWWSWWLGEMFGVLIVTPLIFVFMAPPRESWVKRRAPVALPVTIALSLLLVIFFESRRWEAEQIQFTFHDKSLQIATALKESLKTPQEIIASLERFYTSAQNITPTAFSTFTAYALKNHPSIQALEWIAKVPDARREQYVHEQRRLGLSTFRLTERDALGNLVPAKTRDVYYPVTYVDPYIGNERVLGFDLGSHPKRLNALNKARDTGTLTATERIHLVQKNGRTTGILLLYPVYASENVPPTVSERRRLLRGFVLGVFRLKDIFDDIMNSYEQNDITLIVRDLSAPTDAQLIYGDPATLPSAPAIENSWTIRTPLRLGDRHWELSFTPTTGYLENNRPWQSWVGFNGALMFLALFMILLLVLTGRTARTERLVAERTRELTRSEEKARAIFDTVLDGVILIDKTGLILSANSAAHTTFGYRAGALEKRTISYLIPELTHVTHVSQLALTFNETGNNDVAEDGYVGVFSEVQGLRRDGTPFPVELSIAEMYIKTECLYVVVLRDITERKEVDRIKDEFISTISHELRTPLTSIKGSLGLLVGNTDTLPKHKASELISLALKNAERLILLVNDILDMEKLASGKMTFEKRMVNFADIVRQGIRENAGFAGEYGVSLNITSLREDVFVIVDQARMMQVIANILSNAVKFSPRGGVVDISLTEHKDVARLSVTDHGPGIAPEFHSRIFGRFTLDDYLDTRSGSGTGLGLHISQSIVEKHDGHISFISPPGKGATFFVDLPIHKATT